MGDTQQTDQDNAKLRKLDSGGTEGPTEYSKYSNISSLEKRGEKLLHDVAKAEDARRDLLYDLFERSIITETETRKIRSCYDFLIGRIRSAIGNPQLETKKELLKAKLRTYSEEFVRMVEENIEPYFWVSSLVKGTMLRLKADYYRYLFETHPKCGNYQILAHNAYTHAKSFFTTNHLTKTPEWHRLRLNYAALLYLDGFPTAAMFICQQLLKVCKNKKLDSAFERRVKKNVDFFKRATLD